MISAYENISKEELITEFISEKSAHASLQSSHASLLKKYLHQEKTLSEYQFRITKFESELDQLKRMIFGTKSERFVASENPEQGRLDFNVEVLAVASSEQETITYTREKNKSKNKIHAGRLPIPANIERRRIEVVPTQDVSGLVSIGEEITEELEYNPPTFHVNQYARKKYVRVNGEGIIIADLPSRPIEKGIAGASLLANIVIEKYVDHLPLYRQQNRFLRIGMNIPSATIVGWVNATCELLSPLYDELKKEVLTQKYLQADETPIPVLDKEKRKSTHQGYHWVYHAPELKMVLFDYRPGRGREGPKEILKNFSGHLQTDGYAGYEIFDGDKITLHHCMAHARRKFDQALDNDKLRAEFVLAQMQKLYAVERKSREENHSHEQRYELRQTESVEILKLLHDWFRENIIHVLPKSKIGEAIAYSLSRWERLCLYTTDGKLEIDNNLVENVIRPVALGRKNYLFAGSHEAAQRSAMLYSFMGTCKLRGVEPLAWLTETLRKLPDHKANQLHTLLPGC